MHPTIPARLRSVFLAAVAAVLVTSPTWAKPARCFTTDDGSYSCRFKATDRLGSFEISARGKPTYILQVVQAGTAYGFVNLGGRNVSLPGEFARSEDDPACWSNSETGVKICAW